MPIFEYKCDDCGHEFEELVFDRDACPPCPKCGSEKTGKLISACRCRVGAGGSAPSEGASDSGASSSSFSASSPCSGCSGGNCSSCGH
ncbi:zinc ribbon domain-containing protein [Pseudodesulfovibrio sp.]|uniref:FmdB family zinc ribbon protein n=1 Tax=Pseudodesulfovibrio sp. TaxID=2035812 RepID=UPI002613962C|nr:zinc ribbon domain-containing protein [Pseudodesulfovibrio sp.]MDD3311720.1 zinc ribbon domain-containing protein [Pseudodesulfovibrio sp.]